MTTRRCVVCIGERALQLVDRLLVRQIKGDANISSGTHDAFASRCADQGLIFASFLASAARARRVS